jgi:hypothetical protein
VTDFMPQRHHQALSHEPAASWQAIRQASSSAVSCDSWTGCSLSAVTAIVECDESGTHLVKCTGIGAMRLRSLGCRAIFVSTMPLGPAGSFTTIDQ